jgi:hypothetical protein
MAVEPNELITLAGVFCGGVIAGLLGYFKRKPLPPPADPVLAGIGAEFGNRMQMDELVVEIRRIACAMEILADRDRAEFQETLKEVLERLPGRHP